jgi:hypothetical protein
VLGFSAAGAGSSRWPTGIEERNERSKFHLSALNCNRGRLSCSGDLEGIRRKEVQAFEPNDIVEQKSKRCNFRRKVNRMATSAFVTQTSNWTPLKELVGEDLVQDFMFVGDDSDIMIYKHYMTRHYLNIHVSTGQTYRYGGDRGYLPMAPEVAIASALGPCRYLRPSSGR